jgi:anion-transporting  ArsA/GET3 family ATPase
VGVAIPETMSLEETARLAESLARLGVPMRRLLVNNVVSEAAAGACDFCAARRAAQAPVLKNFAERFGGAVELFLAPQQPQDIHGPALLREHFGQWRPAR